MTNFLKNSLKIGKIYVKEMTFGGSQELSYYLSHKTRHLVAQAKQGDQSALNQLCWVYGERIRRRIRLRMGKELRSKLESVDIVQDALMCAFRNLEDFTYTSEGDFLRWLGRIAENRIRSNLEKLHADKRDIHKEISLNNGVSMSKGDPVQIPELARNTTPSVILSKKEDLDRLEKAIDKLKPEYRQIIVWAKIDGLSYKEIGERLGKSADAAGHLLLRAMVSLTDTFWTI
jgi:RNA polymerase sigma-70 factor (ECF subfamily)